MLHVIVIPCYEDDILVITLVLGFASDKYSNDDNIRVYGL